MQSCFKSVVIENTENLCGFGLRKLLVFFKNTLTFFYEIARLYLFGIKMYSIKMVFNVYLIKIIKILQKSNLLRNTPPHLYLKHVHLTFLGNIFHFDVEFPRHVTQIREDDEASEYTGQGIPHTDDDGISVM